MPRLPCIGSRSGFISGVSGNGCCERSEFSARFAASGTTSCSTPPTSCPTVNQAETRGYRTGLHSASSTTPQSRLRSPHRPRRRLRRTILRSSAPLLRRASRYRTLLPGQTTRPVRRRRRRVLNHPPRALPGLGCAGESIFTTITVVGPITVAPPCPPGASLPLSSPTMTGQCDESGLARSGPNREIRYEITRDATLPVRVSRRARQSSPVSNRQYMRR